MNEVKRLYACMGARKSPVPYIYTGVDEAATAIQHFSPVGALEKHMSPTGPIVVLPPWPGL